MSMDPQERRRLPSWWRYPVALVAILACAAGGAFYAYRSVRLGASLGAFVHNGAWITDRTFASATSTARTRAYLTVVGLLGLPRSEAIYFIADKTSNGKPIDSDGVYEVSGKSLPGRWWSLTLYGEDQFLMPNPHNRYSVRSTALVPEPDGSFRIRIARVPQPGNWIPMGEGRNLSLLLRVYNPDPGLDNRLETVPLPSIRRVGDAR